MNSLLPPTPAARPTVIANPLFLQATEEGGLVTLKISFSFPVYPGTNILSHLWKFLVFLQKCGQRYKKERMKIIVFCFLS